MSLRRRTMIKIMNSRATEKEQKTRKEVMGNYVFAVRLNRLRSEQ